MITGAACLPTILGESLDARVVQVKPGVVGLEYHYDGQWHRIAVCEQLAEAEWRRWLDGDEVAA